MPLIEDRLKLSGLFDRCASVRASGLAVLELEQDPQRAIEAIVQQAELAVSQDKAEVICLGCGGMAGLDEQIRQRHRRAGGRWGDGGGDHCRSAGAAGVVDVESTHLRDASAQDHHWLAGAVWAVSSRFLD